jgi:hypothetical protein
MLNKLSHTNIAYFLSYVESIPNQKKINDMNIKQRLPWGGDHWERGG